VNDFKAGRAAIGHAEKTFIPVFKFMIAKHINAAIAIYAQARFVSARRAVNLPDLRIFDFLSRQ